MQCLANDEAVVSSPPAGAPRPGHLVVRIVLEGEQQPANTGMSIPEALLAVGSAPLMLAAGAGTGCSGVELVVV